MTIKLFVAQLLVACAFLAGCAVEADESELYDEESVVEDEENLGEAESELKYQTTTSGGGDDFCGWFCPVWAKDLSDCLMIPCK